MSRAGLSHLSWLRELNKSPARKSICYHGYQSQQASHHRDGSVSIPVKCEEVSFPTIHDSLMSFSCWGASFPLRYKSVQMGVHNRSTEFAISTALHSVFTAAFWLQFSIQYNCGLEYHTLQTVTSPRGPPGLCVQPPSVHTVRSQGVNWGFQKKKGTEIHHSPVYISPSEVCLCAITNWLPWLMWVLNWVLDYCWK